MGQKRRLLAPGLLLLAFALLGGGAPGIGRAESSPNGSAAGAREARAKQKPTRRAARRNKSKKGGASSCKERPKPFLIRKNFLRNGALDPGAHRRALKWRAERYGYIEGLEGYSSESAISQAVTTRFMGLPLRVHKKIVPKLRCVERTLRSSCNGKGERYVPKGLGGFRESNTYRGGEVSNHLFGIAIDIDSDRNPCCGCVDPWPTHPACNSGKKSVFEKTELPRCWIKAFEQNGFYWLGHDTLEDTMHFEYLGDPDR